MSDDRSPDERLAATAAEQQAAFNHTQARAAGFTRHQIAQRCRTGRWDRPTRNVYTIVGAPGTFLQRVFVAWLAIAGAVVSHRTAAILDGLFTAGDDEEVEVTVRRGRSHAATVARVHQRPALRPRDITTRLGVTVTAPARTAADLAGRLSASALEDLVDEIVLTKRATLNELEEQALAMPKNDLGRQRLLHLLEIWRHDGTPESKWEVKLARALEAAGIRGIVFQHELVVDGKVVARFDLAIPSVKVAIEYESFQHHGGRRGVIRTNRRRNRYQRYGWIGYGATKADIDDGCRELVVEILADERLRPAS